MSREFHDLVVAFTPNATVRYVVRSLVALWSAQEEAWAESRSRRGEYPAEAEAGEVVRTHQRIVDHIRAGQADDAERVARSHLAATQALVLATSEDGIVDAAFARARPPDPVVDRSALSPPTGLWQRSGAMSSDPCHRQRRMRIVVSEFISLDGVVQAPGGAEEDTDGGFRHGGWSMPFFDPEVMGSAIGEVSERTDALLYGRRTWQVMAGAWPGRAGDPFADWINAVEKHVVSDTLSEADLTWGPTSIIRGADLVAARERPARAARAATSTSWAAPSSFGRCSRPTSSTS